MRLIFPQREYYSSYLDAVAEYRKKGIVDYGFSDLPADELFAKFERYHKNERLPANRVPATYLWLVDSKKFIGEISIRHQLNEALLLRGGHIGYGIRCSCWNQGMGTMMLGMALEYIRQHLELEKVLITCDDCNTSSARVIEKNGGLLQDRILNGSILTRRYWITL